jgi:hypothetical protein
MILSNYMGEIVDKQKAFEKFMLKKSKNNEKEIKTIIENVIKKDGVCLHYYEDMYSIVLYYGLKNPIRIALIVYHFCSSDNCYIYFVEKEIILNSVPKWDINIIDKLKIIRFIQNEEI